MARAFKTLLLIAALIPIAYLLGFAITMAIGFGVPWPAAGYLIDAVWVLLIAGIAWSSWRFFQSQKS